MKRLCLTLALMGMMAGTVRVQAQQHNNADMTERMQQMQAKRAERLADELKLQGEARVTFMATYFFWEKNPCATNGTSTKVIHQNHVSLPRKNIFLCNNFSTKQYLFDFIGCHFRWIISCADV